MPSIVSPALALQVSAGPRPTGLGGGGAAEGLTSHITDPVGAHAASAISYDGGGTWADGSTNPASDVEAQLDKIISDLADTTAVTAGGNRIGIEASTVGSSALGAGTLQSRLTSLQSAVRINYTGGGAWVDGTSNPQTNVEAQLDKIVSDLASAGGSSKIQHSFGTNWFGAVAPSGSGDIGASLNGIVSDLASSTAAVSGARKIGMEAVTKGTVSFGAESVYDRLVRLQDAFGISTGGALSSWLGGRTNPDADVATALDKIVTDLGAQTASDDGAERIGAEAVGNLTVGSVRSQLTELDTETRVYLRGRVLGAESADPIMFPLVTLPPDPAAVVAGNVWSFTTGVGGALGLVQATTSSDNIILVLIKPKNCVLRDLSVTLVGESGHAGLPATLPTITLYRQDPGAASAPTNVGSATDPSGTTGAYQVPHSISLTGLTETLTHDGGSRFYLVVSSEASTNALAGLTILNVVGSVNPT